MGIRNDIPMIYILYLYDESGNRTKINTFGDPMLAGSEGLKLLAEYRKDIELKRVRTYSVTIKDENDIDRWDECTILARKVIVANG